MEDRTGRARVFRGNGLLGETAYRLLVVRVPTVQAIGASPYVQDAVDHGTVSLQPLPGVHASTLTGARLTLVTDEGTEIDVVFNDWDDLLVSCRRRVLSRVP